jgi:hypothetical protein
MSDPNTEQTTDDYRFLLSALRFPAKILPTANCQLFFMSDPNTEQTTDDYRFPLSALSFLLLFSAIQLFCQLPHIPGISEARREIILFFSRRGAEYAVKNLTVSISRCYNRPLQY